MDLAFAAAGSQCSSCPSIGSHGVFTFHLAGTILAGKLCLTVITEQVCNWLDGARLQVLLSERYLTIYAALSVIFHFFCHCIFVLGMCMICTLDHRYPFSSGCLLSWWQTVCNYVKLVLLLFVFRDKAILYCTCAFVCVCVCVCVCVNVKLWMLLLLAATEELCFAFERCHRDSKRNKR